VLVAVGVPVGRAAAREGVAVTAGAAVATWVGVATTTTPVEIGVGRAGVIVAGAARVGVGVAITVRVGVTVRVALTVGMGVEPGALVSDAKDAVGACPIMAIAAARRERKRTHGRMLGRRLTVGTLSL
jgi:hypothetical protein